MGVYKKFKSKKVQSRTRRKAHIRKRLRGSAERPRLTVFRSLNHVYVQAVDDDANKVLAATSDAAKAQQATFEGKKKTERARAVGVAIGEALKGLNVKSVVFDRNGYIYHGRVKEVADGAREAGLEF